MTATLLRRLALPLLVLACMAQSGDTPRIAWVRPPAFISTDDTILYQVRIAPHPDNRLAIFSAIDQADGLEVTRSQEELPGADAPRTRWFKWRLPSGHLMLKAVVLGASAKTLAVATVPVIVRGRYDEPEE